MMKKRFLLAAAALSLGFSALPAFAQSPAGDTPDKMGVQNCDNLKGAAREKCLQRQETPRTPGRSEGAASREGGKTPGRSEDAASRTGVPPGQAEKDLPAPAAGGAPKGKAGDGNGAPKE